MICAKENLKSDSIYWLANEITYSRGNASSSMTSGCEYLETVKLAQLSFDASALSSNPLELMTI